MRLIALFFPRFASGRPHHFHRGRAGRPRGSDRQIAVGDFTAEPAGARTAIEQLCRGEQSLQGPSVRKSHLWKSYGTNGAYKTVKDLSFIAVYVCFSLFSECLT